METQPETPKEPEDESTNNLTSPSVSVSNETPVGSSDEIQPSTGSRFGQFMRTLLRWLILVVVLFALGVLATYYFLYRPLNERATRLEVDLAQTRQELDTKTKALTTSESQNTEIQKKVDQLQVELATANNRAYLQMVLTDVANARLALANKDGANARNALLSAKTHLDLLIPAIKEKDAGNTDRADAIAGRLTLALNELSRDARTAVSDLDVLTRNLQDLEKDLFPQ